MSEHQSLKGSGVTFSNLCFKNILLVRWEADLVKSEFPTQKGEREFLTWTDGLTIRLFCGRVSLKECEIMWICVCFTYIHTHIVSMVCLL